MTGSSETEWKMYLSRDWECLLVLLHFFFSFNNTQSNIGIFLLIFEILNSIVISLIKLDDRNLEHYSYIQLSVCLSHCGNYLVTCDLWFLMWSVNEYLFLTGFLQGTDCRNEWNIIICQRKTIRESNPTFLLILTSLSRFRIMSYCWYIYLREFYASILLLQLYFYLLKVPRNWCSLTLLFQYDI